MSSRKTQRKNYTRRKVTSKKTSAPIAWLIGGICIGLIVPGLFYFLSHSKEKTTTSDIKITQIKQLSSTPDARHAYLKVKTKPARTHSEKENNVKSSHYAFYDLLVSHDDHIVNADQEDDSIQKFPDKFLLEIAKFASYVDADQLKAQLLLIGIDEVSISKSKGQHPTYRVTVGPFSSRAQASKAQQQLRDNSIESTMVVG